MHDTILPYEISVSTDEECELISDEIMHFNARAVMSHTKLHPLSQAN